MLVGILNIFSRYHVSGVYKDQIWLSWLTTTLQITFCKAICKAILAFCKAIIPSFMLSSSVNNFALNRVGYTHRGFVVDRKIIAVYVFSLSDV